MTGESGIVTTRRADAELLGKFFARLWYAECTWDAPASEHYRMGPRHGPGVVHGGPDAAGRSRPDLDRQ